MHALLAKPIDWCSIQLARLSVRSGQGPQGQLAEAEAILAHEDFLGDSVEAPRDFTFTTRDRFRFTSPIVSPWGRNNIVHGRLFRAAKYWQDKPTVILLHGWNADSGYRVLYPRLARRLVRRGVNAITFELPYHCQRKPRGRNAIRNFISGDLVHVMQAARQSLADARALIGWLSAQSSAPIGLWGISLGAWLTGLLACADARVGLAVMMTPVVQMDRVIAELEFCEPIRRSLGGATLRLEALDLIRRRPRLNPDNILIVASQHDLFAPLETVEQLSRAWGVTDVWRPRHGHISVLMSMPVMDRTVRWVERKARQRLG